MTKQIHCACVEIHIGFALECAERKSVTLQHCWLSVQINVLQMIFNQMCRMHCKLDLTWNESPNLHRNATKTLQQPRPRRKSRFCCISQKSLSKPHYPTISRSRLQATNRHTLFEKGTFLHFRNVTGSWIESAQRETLRHLTQFLSQRGVFTGIKQIVVQIVKDDVEL